ncbi:MAG: hypothetical protein A3B74_02950 [Candidatus Kerfeldbacteria bacterium RIFCSPHIGHO2_02_FULL_42_14]|uniref:Uncharacterized protein n=1 Tax=Candidatus Kerfeldbacteria bacterium RIFCSPHIGHO2_02_FULL_42_14 TaxID=1798540 RepID=A0A1G2AQ12_9BACT|nr:MAG: hypothetical protein A3B74_02950 [Candidatus Kerfeldbacteria bacterium RIFCSPHIGHO2_02_FULL_42_14]OGY80527.1 MAG: hypothetical protein A3E60_03970 [Candidatus Kerfeldbacteria bacterium RIFCSPHIGHO2_12_FULL_42_13]OGY84102.1 MAG: hypothetical protein A3I91_01260 [Candidatus Kerfeldbacteria bacterium RIFCSPLOWO2_02_FULL_42_19]OGY87233.1 MAG: hypothetical protein A3G01_02730 [Candidatus Kerfeldbacteria bacterium RIFCSPLOWO2_12_FULL_43_9]
MTSRFWPDSIFIYYASFALTLFVLLLGPQCPRSSPPITTEDGLLYEPVNYEQDGIITTDDNGNQLIVNRLNVLATEDTTWEDMEIVSASVGGRIVAHVPMIAFYGIEVPASNFSELTSIRNILAEDSHVIVVEYDAIFLLASSDIEMLSEEQSWGFRKLKLPETWQASTACG